MDSRVFVLLTMMRSRNLILTTRLKKKSSRTLHLKPQRATAQPHPLDSLWIPQNSLVDLVLLNAPLKARNKKVKMFRLQALLFPWRLLLQKRMKTLILFLLLLRLRTPQAPSDLPNLTMNLSHLFLNLWSWWPLLLLSGILLSKRNTKP